MKKNELKQILKPLIKECIKECIFEEGVLSGIVTEVVRGMETQRIVTEGITIKKNEDDEKQRLAEEEYERQRQEKIKMGSDILLYLTQCINNIQKDS